MLLSILTNFLSGVFTLTTTDIKNTLAHSTTAQISYMCALLRFSFKKFSIVQFASHTFYKALLFLSYSVLIHQNKNNQDSRILETNYFKNTLTYTCIVISLLNFISLPSFVAHYSKINLFNLSSLLNFNYFTLSNIFLISVQIANIFTSISLAILLFSNIFKTNIIKIDDHSYESGYIIITYTLLSLTILNIITGNILFNYLNIANNTILNYLFFYQSFYFHSINISKILFLTFGGALILFILMFKDFVNTHETTHLYIFESTDDNLVNSLCIKLLNYLYIAFFSIQLKLFHPHLFLINL